MHQGVCECCYPQIHWLSRGCQANLLAFELYKKQVSVSDNFGMEDRALEDIQIIQIFSFLDT